MSQSFLRPSSICSIRCVMELLLLLLLLVHIFQPKSCQAVSDLSVTENAQEQQESPVLFTRLVYRGSLREHFPFKNESIKQLVPIVPPIRAYRTAKSNSTVRYSILSGDDDGYFRMDALNGELFLVRQLDRESLPKSAAGDRFSLIIQATSTVDTESSRARLVIDVEDINDNAPKFDSNEYIISIVENLPVGFNVLQLSASDPDLEENGRFTYQLIDTSGAFSIDPITGWLSVSNSTPLDRERVDRLILTVEALEERPSLLASSQLANKSLSSTRIDIELTDSNDNSPIFQPTNLYSFTVEALAGAGTVIGQVVAVDSDADDNGLVNYAIQHQQEVARTGRAGQTSRNGGSGRPSNLTTHHDIRVPFSIHPRSGHLIVTDTPLTMKSYTVIVEASDAPANPSERRHSLAVVQISVLTPLLVVPKFVNAPYEFWVGSSAPVDTSVGQVKTEGFLDQEDVRYTLKHRLRKPVPFNVDPRTGIIRVTDDLKPSTSFTLNVTASDGIRDPVRASLRIRVVNEAAGRSVTLQNDEPTVFIVAENTPPGSIGQIVYPPHHIGQNESVRNFEFLPLDQRAPAWQYLRLSRNGTIYTRRSLDRESMTSNLTLFVTVRENGTENRDTLHVSVTIADVNDNAPIFSSQRYLGRVFENVPAETKVRLGQPIRATDADMWPHNLTRYSLTGIGSRLFRIDPMAGEVLVVRSQSLDRERTPIYNLTVTATDGSLFSEAQLTILVEDVNDNVPQISGFVPTVGVVALERSADRQDLPDEGVIIVCADGSCSMPIDLEEREPEQLAPGRMMATYSRFRNHLLRLLDDWIDVAERSLDQTPPDEEEILERAFREILYNSSILIQVPHKVQVNQSLGIFSIEDGDDWTSKSDQLRFALSNSSGQSDDDLFGIVPETGSLFLKKPLQSETVYLIGVQVSDEQGLQSETNIAVQLTDDNSHRPTFDRPFYELFIPEGDYNGTAFVTIEAKDQDRGDGGRLIYSLVDSSQSLFNIDEKSGLLTVNGTIDREQTEFFRFTVQASDEGFPPLKSRVDVVIYVTDVNDNAPQFDLPVRGVNENGLHPLFAVSLTDGTPAGTAVIRVRATDADADVQTNANVTYRLGSHQHMFNIDEVTGSIFTREMLDRSRGNNEYNLLVVAADAGIPRLSTVAVVRITIAEPCHLDPTARRQQSVTLDENIPTPIALVNLTSLEEKGLEMVHLALLRVEPSSSVAQSLFKLDHNEPVLWLMEQLDRETHDTYSIHLRIQRSKRGHGNGTRTNSSCEGIDEEELVLNIRVADINDNPPVFSNQTPFIVVVPSSAAVGYPVVTLSASDADDGNNAAIKYSMTLDEPAARVSNDVNHLVDWTAVFSIDPSSGSVSVSSAVDRLAGRILSYQIKATDRNGNGLSASLGLSLHVLDRLHEVALVLGTGTEDVVVQSTNISRVVSDVSGMQVWIKSVEPHVNGDMVDIAMTDIVLYAKNRTGQLLVTSEDFSRVLNMKRDELDQKLSFYQLREIRNVNRNTKTLATLLPAARLDALEVTLIAMGATVLLGALVAVVCIAMSRLKHKKRSRLVSSPISMTMDYHMQSLRNVTMSGSYNDSSQAALMSAGSSGSSEIYVEVPADKGHPLYVSALPPAHQKQQRYQQQAIVPPICSSCQRMEAKLCKCSGSHPGRAVSSNLPGSDSWLLRRKTDPLCRLHSLPPSCRHFYTHSVSSSRALPENGGENNKMSDNNTQQAAQLLRLDVLQRSKSMRSPSVVNNSSAVRFREEKRHHSKVHQQRNRCQQHSRRRAAAGSPPLVQIHRSQLISQPSVGESNHRHHQISFGSSGTETFEDSLDSSARHQRTKR